MDELVATSQLAVCAVGGDVKASTHCVDVEHVSSTASQRLGAELGRAQIAALLGALFAAPASLVLVAAHHEAISVLAYVGWFALPVGSVWIQIRTGLLRLRRSEPLIWAITAATAAYWLAATLTLSVGWLAQFSDLGPPLSELRPLWLIAVISGLVVTMVTTMFARLKTRASRTMSQL